MSLRANAIDPLKTDTQPQPRLLIADDDLDSAQALALYLERQGYAVMHVHSGKQALAALADFQPHLLILDLFMPDISGFEITMQVRGNTDFAYLPVIMITGQDAERKRLQSMISGADDYLAKPVNELELMVRVQALLRTKSHIDTLWAEKRALLTNLEKRNAELEKALIQAAEADLLKQNILQSVSHEMGTPMLQIKSAVHLLIEDVHKSDPDSVPAKLVQQAVNRLEGIIRNVTDLARSENLKPEPFVLRDSIQLAVRRLNRGKNDETPDQRIQITVPDSLPPVLADRQAVARVLNLLLDNALKFDPKQNLVDITAAQNTDTIRLSVKDHGIGIPESEFERIFREFYQVDGSSTRQFGGSGVGLALAKLLCDQMGLKIYVESKLGVGSTFSVDLPIASLDS